jgi:putative PIN family toxin of toxin-antitoxin system
MNIVLDTNVLVSGLLSPFSPCGNIVRMVSSGDLILFFDARILSEYYEVLHRPKFKFEEEKVVALLDYISLRGQSVAASPLSYNLPDSDDNPFLEVAVSAKTAYLITGNKDHFPIDLCMGIRVVSPQQFLKDYMKQ